MDVWILTLPSLGIQWPALAWEGESPPDWWIWDAHRASDAEARNSDGRRLLHDWATAAARLAESELFTLP